jgi:hypothetical protein
LTKDDDVQSQISDEDMDFTSAMYHRMRGKYNYYSSTLIRVAFFDIVCLGKKADQ